jgi:hypothetical protein
MRSPLKAAFLNPLNLAILALAVAFGLCAAWWLFPLGLIAWTIMFVLAYRDPSLQLDQTIQARSPLAQRFQKPFDRVQRGQISLYNNLRSAKPQVRQRLQPVQDAVNTLTDRAYHLCQRMTTLQNYYLVTKTNRDFEGEAFVLKVKIENSSDEGIRRDYQESLKALGDQANNFQQISTLLERVESQLTSVSNTIENVLVDVIRLQALQPEQIDREMPALLQPILAQSEQLLRFEREAAGSKL